MQTATDVGKFPRWQLAMIIYGGIGVFVGPLLHLFIYGDQWLLFAVLKVVITATAFFCLLFPIGFALDNYWVVPALTVVMAGIFFWRPIGDLFVGPKSVVGDLVITEQIDVYIMRTSYDLEHNVIYVGEITSGDGNIFEVRMTPSQFEKWDSKQQGCQGTQFTFLKNMRKILDVSCSL